MSILLYALGAFCIFGSIFFVAAMSSPPWLLIGVPLGVGLTWLGIALYMKAHPVDDAPPRRIYQDPGAVGIWMPQTRPPTEITQQTTKTELIPEEKAEPIVQTQNNVLPTEKIENTSEAIKEDWTVVNEINNEINAAEKKIADTASEDIESLKSELRGINDRLSKIQLQEEHIRHYTEETAKSTALTAAYINALLSFFVFMVVSAVLITLTFAASSDAGIIVSLVLLIVFAVFAIKRYMQIKSIEK
ncbi:MAG: hypothetical protein IJT56_07310 [Clostridia bacterium]|nr:hypothetical protein [Clostridia bacterium]